MGYGEFIALLMFLIAVCLQLQFCYSFHCFFFAEYNTIGSFLLSLHHQVLFSRKNDWMVDKVTLRNEFRKFLGMPINAELKQKFETATNGRSDVSLIFFSSFA